MKQWDSLWTNANLATFGNTGEAYGAILEGAIAVRDGQIAWVGKQIDLPDAPGKLAENVYNSSGRWITPSLIDCHTHLVYGGNRAREFEQRLAGKTYAEIARMGGGIRTTVAATHAASFEQLYADAARRLRALIRQGVTIVEIKSGYGLDLETEIKMLRVARTLAAEYPVKIVTTFLGAHTIPDEYQNNSDGYIDFVCNEVLPAIRKENLADAVDVYCESIAFSLEQTEKVFKTATELGFPIKLHAEQLSDSRSALLAARYKALSADHLEFVSEESIIAMSEAGTVAVLLPGAYYYLRETKLPPVDLFRQHKVPMAIATDCNPGTSPTTSLLLMLNMACILFHLTAEEAWQGVTINAARALGLADQYGSLEVGKIADFVFWDIEHPVDVVYQMGAVQCGEVVKAGKLFFAR